MRHKDHYSKRNVALCGVPTRGGQVVYTWRLVTCPVCLGLRTVPMLITPVPRVAA